MILSGTVIGFICVFALLVASILLASLDMKERKKGNSERARFLSRLALILFVLSFLGGVGVTLTRGVRTRAGSESATGHPMGNPMGSASIGKVDEDEVKHLQEKVAADAKDVKSRERLGHLYLQMQDFENVFQMAHEALKMDPRSAESLAHMGMVFFAMQQLDQALELLDAALKINPENTEALLFKGIVQFQGKNDLKGAQSTWGKFMKVSSPSDPGRVRVEMFLKTISH